MSRSLKKGPFVEESLEKKINKMNESNEKKVIKTWSRASMIVPSMLGHTIAVHNGKFFDRVGRCPVFPFRTHLFSFCTRAVVNDIPAHVDKHLISITHLAFPSFLCFLSF